MSALGMWRGRTGDLACMKVMRLMQSYLDGATDDITTAQVARHLTHCRRCGLEADTFQAIKAALGRRDRALPAETMQRLRDFVTALGEDDNGTHQLDVPG